MEHLFTSFFRSSAAGSFKEHRMVFQTATPGRIESVAVAEQRQKEMVDRLNNPNDVQAAADARVLSISLALTRDLDPARIDAAKNTLDARIKAREDAESSVKALKDQHDTFRKTEGDLLRAAVGPARDPIVEKLFRGPTPAAAPQIPNASSVVEAMNKIRELSATPAADRGLMQDKLIAQYRDHVRELQNLAGLTPAEKNKLTNPFSSETAADAGSKERLGKAYLATEAGVDTSVANTFRFNKTIAGANVDVKFIWNAGTSKWQIEVTAPAGGPAGPQDVIATTDTMNAAPFNAAPWNVATSEHNTERLRLGTILNNIKTGVVDPTPAGLTTVQNAANAAEVTRAQTGIDNARKTHRDFIANDADAGWSGVVRRLRAGEAAGQPEVVAARKDDIRALGATRKTEIYAAIAALTGTPPADTAIKSSKYVEHMTVLVEQLADIDQRVARLTAAPAAAPTTPTETLPEGERKALEAFNKFLTDNPAVNALGPAEATRKPAIDAIVAQLPTLNTSAALREQGRAALDAKLRTKGYEIATITFSPAALTIRPATAAETTPATEAVRLGTDAERKTLTDAIAANRSNLNAAPVTAALVPFNAALVRIPEGPQRVDAVARLTRELGIPATTTAEGVGFQIDGATVKAVVTPRLTATTGPTAPTGPETKERRERMSEFMKIIIELIRALLQIEQQRTAMMGRSIEAQLKLAEQMRAQMSRTPQGSPEFKKMRADLTRVEGELAAIRKERAERIEKANRVIQRSPNNLLVVEADDDIRRPVRVCVRRGTNLADRTISARVSADIEFARTEGRLPLVATTSSTAAAPSATVPSTAFYVGSINVDNRATTTVNNVNSPGSTIVASSAARTDVAPTARVTPVVRTDTPPPPPRIVGSGPRREGNLNG